MHLRTWIRLIWIAPCILFATPVEYAAQNVPQKLSSTLNVGLDLIPSRSVTPALTLEPAPTNLFSGAFRRGFDDIVRLSWTDNSNNEYSFHIERCAGATCTIFQQIKTVAANVTRVNDYFEFKWGRTYRYRVRAHGPAGYSAYSNIRTQKLP